MPIIPKGSTLTSLAKQYNTTVDELMKANVGNSAIKSKNLIIAGGELKLPNASNLTNTLTQTEIPTETPLVPSINNRELPEMTSGATNFKEGLKLVENYYRKNQATPTQILDKLGQKLGKIMNPDVMSGALGQYTGLKQESASSMFKSALELISEKQQQQQEYAKTVMSALPKSFLSTMSGQDWEEIKNGNVSPKLQQKIAVAQQSETELPTQITEINNRKVLINTQTGEVIKDLGSAYKSGGGGGGGGTGTFDMVVNPEIDTLAKAYLKGETLGSIGATKKAQVLARAEELQKEQAMIDRPKTVEAVTKLIQTARDEGYSDEDIINSFVEDFGFTKESAARMIKPLV